MKPTPALRSFLVLTGSLFFAAQMAQAQLYWDANGTTAGAGTTPTGTWGTDNFWNTDSTGGAGTFSTTTLSTSDLFFSAGTDAVTYTVGLGAGTRNARLVTFQDGTTTLNNGTLSLGNQGGITVDSSTVTGATISTSLTLSGSQSFNIAASRTLTLDTGTFTRNAGATLNVANTGTITTTMTGLSSGSLVNGIIGPWASFGSGASTRYATIDGSNNIVGYTGGTAAATAANVTSTLGTLNYDVAAVGTLGAGANINTLRYTGATGTIAGALTTKGIMNVGNGTLTFSGTVSGGGELVVNTANGDIAFSSVLTSGTTSLVKAGPGRLTTHNAATTFTGPVIVNGGVLQYGDQLGWLTSGNITLNGGVIEQRWSGTNTLAQGTGAGQIQIIGGESGFSENGATGLTWNIGAVTWGSSTFNPSKFVFQTAASQNGSNVNFANTINLNGAERTILVNAGAVGNATATMQAAISGTGASGLIKEGPGILILGVANSYAGNTTISAGTLRIAATDRLGSASNTLIFNGGTLQATGTVTSPSTRAVTMNQTGIIDTNSQAVSIAGNIGGSGGLTKNSNGTLTLSGTNNYGGVTTVNNGTLQITNEVSLASNTAANLNVKNGATLALNVGGAGQFSASTINTLLTNISVANTAAQGLQAGARIGFDTTNAGGTFTQGNAIANSTGNSGGAIGLTKLGTGTLILDKTNTYSGYTLVSGGTLEVQGSIATSANIINNAALVFNSASAQAYGNTILGTGTLTKSGAGTLTLSAVNTFSGTTTVSGGNLTLSNALALRNSALVTTGAGTVTLGAGVTTPTFGGLSGASGNLADVITNYSTVTNITLNPASGVTNTYGGVIGAGSGVSLTKTGAGTQILTGANLYTGATTINQGTLQIGSGTTGSLNGTTGTTLTFTGTGTFNVQEAAGVSQGMGALNLSAGDGTLTSTWNNGVGNGNTAVTFASLATRSAGATVNFTLAGTGSTAANNRIALTSTTNAPLTTTSNNAGMFFGGSSYARYNTTTNTFGAVVYGTDTNANAALTGAQTTLGTIGSAIDARYNGSAAATANTTASAQNGVTVLNVLNGAAFRVGQAITGTNITANTYIVSIAGNALTLNQATGNVAASAVLTPYNLVSAQTTDSLNTLSLNGLGASLALASSQTLSVNGILRSGNNSGVTGVISGGTGIQTATANGDLVIRTDLANDTLNISSNILANGTSAVTKSGAGTLILRSTASTYTGGTFINAGTLTFTGVGALGASGSRNITFGGTASLTWGFDTPSLGTLTVNQGAVGNLTSLNSITFATTTGSGTIRGTGGQNKTVNLGNAGTFTGNVELAYNANNNSGANAPHISFSNLNDAVGSSIQIYRQGGGTDSGQVGQIGLAGNTGSLTFNNRQIQLLPRTGGTGLSMITNYLLNNNGSAANHWVINTNLLNLYDRDSTLGLGGSNTGANAFNGTIGNSAFTGAYTSGTGVLGVIKEQGGTWILGGANTYTGSTNVTGGTLVATSLANGGAASSIGASSNAAGNLLLANGTTLRYTGSGHSTDRRFTLNVGAAGHGASLDASGTGAVNFTNTASPSYGTVDQTRTLTLTGTNTGNNTLASTIANNGTGAVSLNKTGIGTWVLSGANTNTGATNISGGGTLVLDYATNDNNKIAGVLTLNNGGGDLTLRGGSHLEAVTSTTFGTGGGHTHISREVGSTAKLALGAITRGQGGSVTMSLAADGLATTTASVSNGILTGGIIVGSNWAKVSSGDIVALVPADYTTLTAAATTATLNYQLSGTLSRTAASVNSLRIVGSNDTLTITSGNLLVGAVSVSGNTYGGGASGGILYTGGGDYTITGSGNVANQSGNQELVIHTLADKLTLDMIVALGNTNGTLTKAGAGTLALTKANTYTGATFVNQGVLQLRNNTAAGTATNTLNAGIVVANNAALELANSVAIGTEALTITGSGVSSGGALRNVASNTSSYAGAITVGAGGARINSDTGGALTLTGGVVTSLFNDVTFGGAGNTTVSTTAISGAGGLTKDGAGTTTLSATNTYTGATNVNAGTLAVSAGNINSTSAINVAAGATFTYNSSTALTVAPTLSGTGSNKATFSGSGTINAALTLDSIDDVLSPGNSPGIQTFGVNQTWTSFTYEWEVNDWAASVAGTNFDEIKITGTLDLDGLAYALNVLSLTSGNVAGDVPGFTETNKSWTVLTTTGGISNFNPLEWTINDTGFTNADAGDWSLSQSGNNLVLTYTAIPEPSSALLAALSSLFLLRRRRAA